MPQVTYLGIGRPNEFIAKNPLTLLVPYRVDLPWPIPQKMSKVDAALASWQIVHFLLIWKSLMGANSELSSDSTLWQIFNLRQFNELL